MKGRKNERGEERKDERTTYHFEHIILLQPCSFRAGVLQVALGHTRMRALVISSSM